MLDCFGQEIPRWTVQINGWLSWSETHRFAGNHFATVTKRRCKSELFMRISAPSTRSLGWRSSASKMWSFAVWILPHHATVAHGWIAHARLTRDAWATAFAFGPIKPRESWLTWRALMTVALRASWTCCDYLKKKINSFSSWRNCAHLNQATLNISSLLLWASTWWSRWAWVSSHAATRTSLLSTHTWFSLEYKNSL